MSLSHSHPAAEARHDTVGLHGMLVIGSDPVYLSHLPMFMSPHNFQVILRATLEDGVAKKVRDLRAHFGADVMVTLAPEPFPIIDVVAETPRTEFRGNVVRGHFEHGGDVIGGDSLIRIDEVVHFAELPIGGDQVRDRGDLSYLLFGDAERELYLAHGVLAAPDFDQVLVVEIGGATFTEQELERQGRPSLTVPGRPNSAEQRLLVGERVAAHTNAGQHFHTEVEVEVVSELYLMEDELR